MKKSSKFESENKRTGFRLAAEGGRRKAQGALVDHFALIFVLMAPSLTVSLVDSLSNRMTGPLAS